MDLTYARIFVAKLKATTAKFKKIPCPGYVADPIRDEQNLCPICSLCFHQTGRKISNSDWKIAASLIGLPEKIAKQIAFAADYSTFNTVHYRMLLQTLCS